MQIISYDLTKYVNLAIAIVVHLLLITYLAHLGGLECPCAQRDRWEPKFILIASCTGIAMIPLFMYAVATRDRFKVIWNTGLVKKGAVLLLVVGAIKAYAMFSYSLTLYNCECSRDWRRTLLLWQGIISVIGYGALVSLALYLAFIRYL